MKKHQIAALALGFMAACSAFAARDFTPQAGTWIVSSELDGKPGRGLAIDVQGNTFFMQVFGYEPNGDATFYTATGQMDGNGVTAPLMRWRGGRSFGGEARDGVEDGSPGEVKVSFMNGLNGTVQFPGEVPVAIERLLVNSQEPAVTNPLAQLGRRAFQLLALDEQGAMAQFWLADFSDEAGVRLGINDQQLACTPAGAIAQWHCVAPDGVLPIGALRIQSLDLRLAAGDVGGAVQVVDTQGQRRQWTLVGQTQHAFLSDGITAYQQSYASIRRRGACMDICTRFFHTLMPFNGTWVIADELTGKPGRGLALDIQGSTAVLQAFNYRADGQPTFHMGSSTYGSKGADTLASVAQVPLHRYGGGRSLGGPAQSAHEEELAGTAALEFAVQDRWADTWSTGTITLPGEAPKTLRRLVLEPQQSLADHLLGEWYMPYRQLRILFDRVLDNGMVSNADGSVVCWPGGAPFPDTPGCGQPDGQLWAWAGPISLPIPNNSPGMLRIRDRHGNLVGLGPVLEASEKSKK
ncbi:hypothetical protein [Comamonas humi]